MFYNSLPVELGQEFRKKTMANFRDLLHKLDTQKQRLYEHKTQSKNAHNSKQISHKNESVYSYLNKFDNRLKRQIIGANGDGIAELTDARVSIDGEEFDILSERLEHDFKEIISEVKNNYDEVIERVDKIRYVNDYGADPTGEKDSTKAFKEAFGNGGHHVHMTEGKYKVTGLKLPNNTVLSGEGKDISTIFFCENTPQKNLLITNEIMDGTAENIVVMNMTLDGKKERQDGTLQPAGGSLSSNLRFAGVKYGYAYNVKSQNSLLHGFDVTWACDPYYYEGDGNRVEEELESKFIHIDNCEAKNFTDDGITSHHSRYLLITNNYCHKPPKDSGNHNGIEIDDGTRFSVLAGNTTKGNFGGLEIKAHGNTSAPDGIFVSDHLSIEDTRSYNIRHIGHHRADTDEESKTAYSVMLNNCMALHPYYNEAYENSTPRAMVISAYKNVLVNNFTAIGDGRFQENQPAIAVQFMSENVILNNINVSGFKNALADIKINGGDNRPKNVTISNVNITNSSVNRGIAGGSSIEGLGVYNANLIGSGKGNGVEMYNHLSELVGLNISGYENAVELAGVKYEHAPSVLKGGFSGGSTGGGAINRTAALIASTGGSFAYDKNSFVLASNVESKSYGTRSGVINSSSSETLKDGFAQLIALSRSVKSLGNYHFQMGYGDEDTPRTSNTKIDMNAFSGSIKTASYIKSGQDIGDIAEYFESESGKSIPNGTIVTNNGRYIKKANKNDVPLGVISANPGILMGDTTFHYKDKYLKDEFGSYLTEIVDKTFTDEETGEEYSQEVEQRIINPEFDDDLDEQYQSREQREEWCAVGLLGQIKTRVAKDVQAGDLISSNNGQGIKDNENGFYKVLEITMPYDNKKGYAVANVLVK